eukprot:CAMPEP_0206584624 /NCGR_PEP_ID=MMETSP0325_2-20121206/35859_1 /ASSEMBLY_ACC=CAM_ASM_000347 /TAXON_ID=2866 /ORGANISM="Crypthecodinium cohnii, Strain Seligo" /LENGTH=112 /DNA_ID=CAMNT_0054091869 /DNA_START=212 /DNA_END=546 /DNA_ORIENTATION=+
MYVSDHIKPNVVIFHCVIEDCLGSQSLRLARRSLLEMEKPHCKAYSDTPILYTRSQDRRQHQQEQQDQTRQKQLEEHQQTTTSLMNTEILRHIGGEGSALRDGGRNRRLSFT